MQYTILYIQLYNSWYTTLEYSLHSIFYNPAI